MGFKIAYGAGHYLYTAGKRIPPELDPVETREWVLNDRVARYFAQAAKEYQDVELLRVDDPNGEIGIDLWPRCESANQFGADFALAIHHNAGANLTDAGGVVAFSYPGSVKGAQYRDAIYDACIAAGGLRGDRAEPKQEIGFYVLKYTTMPAVLMEYGFMDSTLDAPVILQESYAKAMAYATMEAIAAVAGLQKTNPEEEIPASDGYTLEQFIRDVQAATGSQVDGIAGPETIGNTVTVSRYSNEEHPVVAAVQRRLAELGYSQVGPADGVTGPKFQRAVVAFQKDHDCVADGEITANDKTWRKLLKME